MSEIFLPSRSYRPVSVVATFFHSYPRMFNASRLFSSSPEYRAGLYKQGIPFFITALILLLIFIATNLYFYLRYGVFPGADDTRESEPHRRDTTGRIFLLLSFVIYLGLVVCMGIASSCAFTIRSAARTAHHVIDAAHFNVSYSIVIPAKLAVNLSQQFQQIDIADWEGTELTAVNGVVTLFKRYQQQLANLVEEAELVVQNIMSIDYHISYLSNKFFWFTIAILLACLIGLILTFVCDATLPDSTRVRITSFALLLLPMVAAWGFLAVSTWVSIASGDFCVSVDNYQKAVLNEINGNNTQDDPNNVFSMYKLHCPKRYANISSGLRSLNSLFGASAGFDEFPTGLELLTNGEISIQDWEKARKWTQGKIIEYEECETQLATASLLSHYMCGETDLSAISAVGKVWLSSVGIALMFTLIVALLSCGHPPSEFITARELLFVYGAPKLISALGDVENMLGKYSEKDELELEVIVAKKISPCSSDCSFLSDELHLKEELKNSSCKMQKGRSHVTSRQKSMESITSSDSSEPESNTGQPGGSQ